jgi:hypothetical protein
MSPFPHLFLYHNTHHPLTVRGFLIQNSLRTPHLALPRHYPRRRLPDGNRQRLKRALGLMMIIVTLQHIHMQCNTRVLRKTAQAMRYHLRAQVANLLPLETRRQVGCKVGPVREVDYGA